MSTIGIRTLESVPPDELLESHNRAFSDYAVPFQLTAAAFEVIQRQNGVRLEASFGAFDGAQLIGIWLNGLRRVDDVPFAYDAGTAIWPEYRGQGISTRLAAASDRHLEALGVQRYRLEVLTGNEQAYRVYEKSGFRVRRKLICLSRERGTIAPGPEEDAVIVEDVPLGAAIPPDLPPMEYEPSWQNHWDAMLAIAGDVRLVTARHRGRTVGYGVTKHARGTLTQIAWLPEYQEHPAVSRLLDRLLEIAQTDVVRILNIDEGAVRTLDWFARHGFELMVTQYEMEKPLGQATRIG